MTMSTLTSWRRHVHRTGRDLGVPAPIRVPLAVGLVAGLGFLGYQRYRSVKVGDTVVVNLNVPATAGGATTLTPTTAKVLSMGPGPNAITVAPIVGGVQAPVAIPASLSAVQQNMTPRLF
jgi:hypothetical protein